MSYRCPQCCQTDDDCKCRTQKGPHRCFRCNDTFEVGDQYKSDAPGIVYHLKCYIAEARNN